MEKRYLEISNDGIAFHEAFISGGAPPLEVYYCDCQGPGKVTWNPQHVPHISADTPDAICQHCQQQKAHLVHTPDGLVGHVFLATVTRPMTLSEWQAQHKECGFRRQVFVDVTHRPGAQIGMRYDEPTDTFSTAPPTADASPAVAAHG